MNLSNVTSLLGSYYPEAQLRKFLETLGFSEKPQLPKGSMSTHLIREDLGIEITLTGERYLDNPERTYPEGALVLKNIRFYGAGDPDYSPFYGILPHGLQFGSTLEQIYPLIGKPDWFDEDLAKARWKLSDHAVFANFNKNGQSRVYSFQMPISED